MQSRAGDVSGLTTLVDRIRYWASADPERHAFVFRRHDGSRFPLSRAAYLRLATRFAARLQSVGLQPGDVVCNLLVNSPERAVTDLGIMLSGAVPMNGAPLLADGADVKGCLRKGGAKALLVDPGQKDGAWDVCQTFLQSCKAGPCRTPDLPDLSHVLHSRRSDTGSLLLLEELEAGTDHFHPVAIHPDDAVYIFTTSGSTGFSKLVMHTNRSLLQANQQLQLCIPHTESDNFWNDNSLGWIGGFPHWLITFGSTRVLTDVRAGVPKDMSAFIWNNLVEEKCNKGLLFGPRLEEIHSRPELWKESGFVLDQILTGGHQLGKGCLKTLTSSGGFARELLLNYSSTECGIVCAVPFTAEDQYEEFLTGTITSGLSVRIVDADLRAVPTATRGEILVKTKAPFAGYVGDEEATKKALTDDGWFRTNDLGYLDDGGRLYVMGRQSDTITRGTFIVYPQWLEVRVRGCPGVKDVVVVPVPDSVLYQEICACVLREAGSDVTEGDLAKYCDALFVSGGSSEKSFKPKYFLILDVFPRSKNDKVDKKILAKMAAEMFGLL